MPHSKKKPSMRTWDPENVFAGTAGYYARYRPGYPDEVIHLLREKFKLTTDSRVLDLGCGTGKMALELAPYVAEVVALDPLEEMLQEGRLLAVRKGITNIKWLLGESGNLSRMASEIGEIDLAVIAQAFHWMDREQTLNDLYSLTKPGGGVAVITSDGPKTDFPDTEWKVVINDTVRSWLGDVRKAGTRGIFSPPTKRFEAYLKESDFTSYTEVSTRIERTWTADSIIGYLYSTSLTSIPVLGDKKESFEADLRKRLAELNPDGTFQEEAVTKVMMVWKGLT